MLKSVWAYSVAAVSNRRTRIASFALTAGLAMLALPATPARAYEEDTHFTMTLVLCQAAGLSYSDALIVASYDQGMDDSA